MLEKMPSRPLVAALALLPGVVVAAVAAVVVVTVAAAVVVVVVVVVRHRVLSCVWWCWLCLQSVLPC